MRRLRFGSATTVLLLGVSVLGCSNGGGGGGGSAASAAAGSTSATGGGGLFASGSGAPTGGASPGASPGAAPITGPWAQGLAGIYAVTGSDPARGAYSGQVELRFNGTDYDFVRTVEYGTFTYNGRPVSTVWATTAQDNGLGGLTLAFTLDRMGWAKASETIPVRPASDGVPMSISGSFAPSGPDFSGGFQGQGPPFADPTETWTYQGPPGATPIWTSERKRVDGHNAPSALTKLGLFQLFRTFHRVSYIAPYVSNPEFDRAVYQFTYDRTDFALHRARPDLLRVIGKLVDPLNLEEAVLKADAFGKPLHQKAREADLEVPLRFIGPNGELVKLDLNGSTPEENDGMLWSSVYAYSQAARYMATGEQVAKDNAEKTARAIWVMMAIARPDGDFSRSIRASTGLPVGPGSYWRAGTGRFAGIEWKIGGNNDMYKGLLWGGLTLIEVGSTLKADFGAELKHLAATNAVCQGTRRMGNRMYAAGLVSQLTGSSSSASEYSSYAHNPLLQQADATVGGGFYHQGISDWSGVHLNITGLAVNARLAELHTLPQPLDAARLALRRAFKTMKPTRRVVHNVAAAALGQSATSSPIDVSDALHVLQETPFPRSELGDGRHLKQDYTAGPYPNLPWKQDWTTRHSRALGIVCPPFFEWKQSSYLWKDPPWPRVHGTTSSTQRRSTTDLLFPYWMARAYGVIGPNE
jgi:hypothetical protein